jgi:hypothetical protein
LSKTPIALKTHTQEFDGNPDLPTEVAANELRYSGIFLEGKLKAEYSGSTSFQVAGENFDEMDWYIPALFELRRFRLRS